MFSRIIKEFFLKKIVNTRLKNYKLEDSSDKISTIGIIINESVFKEKASLLAEIEKNGFKGSAVTVLVFKDKKFKKEELAEPFYTTKDISIKGFVKKETVQEFIETPFDLLISYYDEPRPSLDIIAKKSKAKFKVGFGEIDKRINHLIIDTSIDQYSVFVHEVFKYLQILNKV